MIRLAVGAALFVVVLSPAAAAATSSEIAELARDAVFDDDARERLQAVDDIDGRPVDMERVLAGAEGTEIERRVEALLQRELSGESRDASGDRDEARQILAQDHYRAKEIPRPLRGPLEWMADRLEPVRNAIEALFGWIADLFRSLARVTPGGAATLWTLGGLAVVVLVALSTQRLVERRSREREAVDTETATRKVETPRELERQAAAARARGDHELAVRLLFRAGLLRLVRARAIPARTSLTTGEIRRLLDLPAFDRVGTSFDQIAYGRRPARDKDADEARVAWSEILEKVAR